MKILIATHNFGKFKELMEVLGDLPFKFVSLNDENVNEEAEEHGETYEQNAILKAKFYGQKTGLPAIADDSGILVEAIEGSLGVHTRRWGAGEKATDEEWLDFFLNRMSSEKNRNATFVSVIALYQPGKETLTFRGECKGIILSKPQVKVEPGIPLSAVFLPGGKNKVFSALDKHEKNEISHRGKAIRQCHDYLLKHLV
jgi:XTP/dITP diphosphohydrolase